MLKIARYGTRDIARARQFYDGIAEVLGAKRVIEMDTVTAWQGPVGGMFVIGLPLEGEANVGNGTQITFEAESRAMVDAAYARALELGGECAGPPGLRGPAERGLYFAYFRDLDGNKILVSHIGAE
jgi:catechol 2,3-dioxygenase-like lactoylglutathione lyase family enzyme